eukprot:TRINITY_DN60869_c0_g1_i1.p1 TRINITY_DN60869_c0_g1~~TRINITY_DN60869_c0_g1_i1.p1  ORF type:complete len:538 (-),score=95.61 TRINITY_DN60869_c0_g1_i1:153-1739(-)
MATKKSVMKSKKVLKRGRGTRVNKGSLRSALISNLKKAGGRKDVNIAHASAIASKSSETIPIEERAGFPIKLAKGCVHPKDWKTHNGVKIIVDYNRAPWLPDDWGQGVKQTQPTAHSTGRGGGILTTYVAPDGKSFFHKATSEKYAGRPLTNEVGWNGQVRVAKKQAQQGLKLARAEGSAGGLDKDESLFKVLSAAERKCLPKKEELHVGVVSARRATKLEGVRDIFMVEMQFREAGLTPTWYVDEGSLKDYKALGLQAVVGGKLTEARNKVLRDARSQGKVCVQVSDDISAWEYRDGANAKVRTDDALNAAHAAARRLIVSPVAAARFIVAKMRSCPDPKPKLGGVYMLGSCARVFSSDPFARHHFILGDFFCVEPDSTVKFDLNMKLKEDYDFTCAHISKYGSVMRCNRMTLNVKHYSNSGGAVSARDKKGQEELRNVGILKTKWPGMFRDNPKRKNEVILQWKTGKSTDDDDDADGDGDSSPPTRTSKSKVTAKVTASAASGSFCRHIIQAGWKDLQIWAVRLEV